MRPNVNTRIISRYLMQFFYFETIVGVNNGVDREGNGSNSSSFVANDDRNCK